VTCWWHHSRGARTRTRDQTCETRQVSLGERRCWLRAEGEETGSHGGGNGSRKRNQGL